MAALLDLLDEPECDRQAYIDIELPPETNQNTGADSSGGIKRIEGCEILSTLPFKQDSAHGFASTSTSLAWMD